MIFPPVYVRSPKIIHLSYELDILKAGYLLHPVSESRAINLRRMSLLKSSLYSAKIEGNPLELGDIDSSRSATRDIHKKEIFNLLSGYEKLSDIFFQGVSMDALIKLHAIILDGISAEAGQLRAEESAIYNQAGIAVYLTPAPKNVFELLTSLCSYTHTTADIAPVAAGVAHMWFEKIHPFLDGNGRMGRLLSSYILKASGYDFSGLVPFEEYLDKHRDDYYHYLGQDKQDVTEFIEFYLASLLEQAKISLSSVHTEEKEKYPDLLPRRSEILHIIEDHKIITFDFLARRFRAIPTRTLHHDLAQLAKLGLVQKKGSTRGACYTMKES